MKNYNTTQEKTLKVKIEKPDMSRLDGSMGKESIGGAMYLCDLQVFKNPASDSEVLCDVGEKNFFFLTFYSKLLTHPLSEGVS